MNMSQNTIGFLSLFVAAFLYGSQNVATRIAGGVFAPFQSTAIRVIIVILGLIWFVKWKPIQKKDWKWFALRSIGNIISSTGLFFAIAHISVGAALFSFYAGMILTSGIAGYIWYNEKITPIKIVSLVLTAIGLLLIYATKSGLVFNIYIFISVISGAGAAFWSVFSRPISSSYSLLQLVVVDSLFTAIAATGISVGLRESWSSMRLDSSLVSLVYLGFTQMFTGQLVTRGIKIIDAQIGSIILLNDTVIGIVLMYIFFREIPEITVILGGVCIFIASIWPAIAEHKKGKNI